MKIIKLKYPVQSVEGDIQEVKLRQLIVSDIVEIGQPFNMQGLDDKRIVEYISRLSGMLPADVRKIMPSDYIRIANAIVDFFTDAETE